MLDHRGTALPGQSVPCAPNCLFVCLSVSKHCNGVKVGYVVKCICVFGHIGIYIVRQLISFQGKFSFSFFNTEKRFVEKQHFFWYFTPLEHFSIRSLNSSESSVTKPTWTLFSIKSDSGREMSDRGIRSCLQIL